MIGLTPDITQASVPQHGVLRLTIVDGVTGEVYVLDPIPHFHCASTGNRCDVARRRSKRSGLSSR